MKMGVGLTSLLALGIFCSLTWARVQRQVSMSCGSGMVECGPGAHRQCIPEGWVCDGDNDCGDRSDEQNCESRECPAGYVRCQGPSPSRRCIRESWLCDNDNDCGNGWDENTAACSGSTCRPGTIKCPGQGNNRCINERWLCDGDNDCGDNSDEHPENCPLSESAAIRRCAAAMQHCVVPIGMEYMMMNEQEVMEKLRTTDLRQTCRPVLAAQECAASVMSSSICQFPDTQNPMILVAQRQFAAVNTAVDFVCRDNVDAFNEHKECLLRYGTRAPAIVETAQRRCGRLGLSSHCIPSEGLNCLMNTVTEQCGGEIAGYLRSLASQVLQDMGCTSQKRSKMTKKEKMMAKEKTIKKKAYSPLEMLHESFSSLF